MFRGRAGTGPKAQAATSPDARIIRWFTSPMPTPRLVRRGPAGHCQQKPSGSSLRGAGWTARNPPGATNCRRMARRLRTHGRDHSRGGIPLLTATSVRHRSEAIHRTATDFTTWPGTPGTGHPIGIRRGGGAGGGTGASLRFRRPNARESLLLAATAAEIPEADEREHTAYQINVFKKLYPAETVIGAFMPGFVPYSLLTDRSRASYTRG